MFLASIIAALLNIVVAVAIVPLLLGEKYIAIKEVIWIASVALIPLFMGSVQEVWIAHQRTTSIVLKKVIIGLPISMGFLYLFITSYGLHGVAFGMVASYFTSAIIMNYLYDRRFLRLQLSAIGFSFVR
jgi:O-antigen/teichoic acid export membrane protein